MKKFLRRSILSIFPIFSFLTTISYAQTEDASNPYLDSLILVVREQKETNTQSARVTLGHLHNAPGINTRSYPAQLALLEGEILLEENQEEEGQAKVEEGRLLFEKSQNKQGLAAVYDALTKFNLRAARYPEALTFTFKAIEIREELDDIYGLARSFTEVADIYWYYQRFEESIAYGLKAMHLIENKGPSEELAAAYKMLSESYLEIPDYDQALDYINQAIKLKISLGANPLQLTGAINSRGNIYKFLSRYDEAIQDYSANLQICDSLGYQIGSRASAANLGHVYLMKKEYARAIPYKLKSLDIQESTGQVQQVAENLLHLSEAYAGLGEYQLAYVYRTKLDSVKSLEHFQALDKLSNELSVKYETEKKEEAIENLNDRLRLQNISMILGASLLIISLIAVLIFLRLNSRLKIRNKENEILLKEIHHRVKNNLQILSSLLSLQSDHLVDAGAIDAITEGKNRVESMGMIHQRLYSGSDITTVDMTDYIHDLCRFLEDSFSASNKEIRIIEHISYGQMDVDYAIPLGLIINELVTNSVKYAFHSLPKGTLSINLHEQDKMLILIVSDDGSGIKHTNSEGISTSFGSQLIETLSKKLRGEITIDVTNGYSTSIKFTRYKNQN